MKRADHLWLSGLLVAALLIWLRDLAWVSAAWETLPVLTALPLFLWLGAPWQFRPEEVRWHQRSLLAAGVLLGAGLATDLTLLLAGVWTLALWSWLRARVVANPVNLRRLLLLPLMAFPWLTLDLAPLVLLSLAWRWIPAPGSPDRWKLLPRAGLGFVSREVPLTPVETEVYRHTEAVKRLYQAGTDRFVLTAVDGSRDRHAVHEPLYCFRGDGWQVVSAQTLPVPGGCARRLNLTRAGRHTEVVFWFTDGRERHASAGRAWWRHLLSRLTLGSLGGEPALVLLQPASTEAPVWTRLFARCPFLFEP